MTAAAVGETAVAQHPCLAAAVSHQAQAAAVTAQGVFFLIVSLRCNHCTVCESNCKRGGPRGEAAVVPLITRLALDTLGTQPRLVASKSAVCEHKGVHGREACETPLLQKRRRCRPQGARRAASFPVTSTHVRTMQADHTSRLLPCGERSNGSPGAASRQSLHSPEISKQAKALNATLLSSMGPAPKIQLTTTQTCHTADKNTAGSHEHAAWRPCRPLAKGRPCYRARRNSRPRRNRSAPPCLGHR